jgi:transposase
VRAAREALGRDRPGAPRRRGDHQALRVLLAARRGAVAARTAAINQLKALVVGAPEALRAELRALGTAGQVAACATLAVQPQQPVEHRMTAWALRSTARRVQALTAEAADLEAELARLVAQVAPALLALRGVGPVNAAQVLCAWSHPGRLRSEAAFAMLAGVAPLEASSGRVVRHRLNRSGDRQLNRALHTIVLVRLRDDPQTRAYAKRRTAEGKSAREVRRCLKRAVARQLFKLLERHDAADAGHDGRRRPPSDRKPVTDAVTIPGRCPVNMTSSSRTRTMTAPDQAKAPSDGPACATKDTGVLGS